MTPLGTWATCNSYSHPEGKEEASHITIKAASPQLTTSVTGCTWRDAKARAVSDTYHNWHARDVDSEGAHHE
jgi:hypothetical protein